MLTTLIGRTVIVGAIVSLSTPAVALNWDVSLWGERRASTEHVHRLAELVAEKTDGAFTLNIVYDDLSKSTENLDGISLGAFEMAQFCAGYHVDKTPALTVLELPLLGISTLEQEMAVSRAVFDHPAVVENMARWKAMLLMPSPTPPYAIVGVGDAPGGPADFTGKRVRAVGGQADTFAALGAVPTQITSSEAFEAMEAGIVDMVSLAPHAHLSFRTLELADWILEDFDIGTVACPIAVSTDAFEELSPEHRGALLGSIDDAMQHYVDNYTRMMERWDVILDTNDVVRVSLPEAELQAYRELATPLTAKWIERMTARQLPAQDLVDLVDRTLRDDGANSN